MSKAAFLLAAVVLTGSLQGPPAFAQPPMPTKDFVQAAAESDQFEILEGQVAAVESHNPQVRAFAQRMIADHARTSQALQAAAIRSGMTPPPMGLSGDQQKLLSALQSQSGPDFDLTYVRQQVLAHRQALVVEQGYASAGSDPNVRQAARSAVPIIEHHLDTAQQMRTMMGGS